MNIYILTHNAFKEKELSKYFHNIGLNTIHIKKPLENTQDTHYLCVTEQTTLVNSLTQEPAALDCFSSVIHQSEIVLDIVKDSQTEKRIYKSFIEGFIFPHLKTQREDVYNWDDIFVVKNTMKTYQDMKDKGIKTSARDIAFSQLIDDLPEIFQFEKINLNFNPVTKNEVISFEPILNELFKSNKFYNIAYRNDFFKPIIDYLLADGLFIRRASNRKQKNYWIPGLNAGLPLTPKKDELHELTFMFHDIMHFIFPDLIVTDDSIESRHKYFISRMISEAFTLVLADILFISLLHDNHIEYDYTKRKIFPIFQNIKFDITQENLPQIKDLLWANTCFALLGDDTLQNLVNNDSAFEIYRSKYQQIFQDDYSWTIHNYANIAKNHSKNKEWLDLCNSISPNLLTGTDSFCPQFNIHADRKSQIKIIFDEMFAKLSSIVKGESIHKNTSVMRYMAGQMFIFYQYDTIYNALFLEQIKIELSKATPNIEILKNIYNAYIDILASEHYITTYEADNYKNIYPFFEPFYVFYERDKKETFKETLERVFNV